MSAAPKRPLAIFLRVAVLAAAFGSMWLSGHWAVGEDASGAALAALGFLLLAGDLSGQLGGLIGLPHLTGYLLAGVVSGPYVLHLIDHHTVGNLQAINGLALGLIALSAGAELTIDLLTSGMRTILWGVATQVTLLFFLLGGVFLLLRPFMPFVAHEPFSVAFGLALLWAVVAVVKSPSAVLGVLSETGARGPLQRYAVAMVVILDVVVLVVFAITLMFARVLIEPAGKLSLSDLTAVGHELGASLAVGTTVGLGVILFLKLFDGGVILFLVAITFGANELAKYFSYDALIIFAVAGFVVQNLSRQGPKLLASIEHSGSVIFVIFFANAGAHLDLPTLGRLWPVALALAGARGIGTFGAAWFGGKMANDPPVIRRYGWTPLVSQAGIAIGVAVTAEQMFPGVGAGFRSLAIAVVGINEAVGPILFKTALERAGEVKVAEKENQPTD